MTKATDKLLTDHRLIRKVMEAFHPENPRFGEIASTLHRTVVGHAWFEDAIFLPALQKESSLRRLSDEIAQEHKDINELLTQLRLGHAAKSKEWRSYALQVRVLLETHFSKEEEGLFPLSERVLDSEGLNKLGDEMERRKTEVRDIVKGITPDAS